MEGLPKAQEEMRSLAARRRRGERRLIAALAVACALAAPRAASADDDDPTEVNLNRARKLMESRATLDDACRWLEKAYNLTKRGDMLLNLAECHRRQGKTATALAEFDLAMRIGAQVKFPEAVAAAARLRDDLARRISRVTVVVPPAVAALPTLAIELNGKPLPKASWNTPVNHDPGPIEVTATAKGHKRFAGRVELGAEKDTQTIDVALEAEPPPPPPPPVIVPREPPPQSIWPWIVGGIGVGLAGAAIAFEVDSTAAGRTLDARCGGSARDRCPRGFDFESPRARELRGFGLFVGLGAAGLAAMGTGATVLVWRRVGKTGTQTSLWLSPSSASVSTSF
jgi:hypothetical protein